MTLRAHAGPESETCEAEVMYDYSTPLPPPPPPPRPPAHSLAMTSREDFTYLAKLAEHADRHEDMVSCMKKVISLSKVLSVEERNLLSIAYKNIVGARRASWRIVASIEQREESRASEEQVLLINNYRQKIEKELQETCEDILGLLDRDLIPSASSGEFLVFYNKLKGDYYRYLAEITSGEERTRASDEALNAYSAASETASTDLSPTHSLRIGLALNFSVFYYEILNNPEKACKLAREAFDQAIMILKVKVDDLSEESYRESLLIMNLLKDNLTLWTGDVAESVPQEEDAPAIAEAGSGNAAD